MPPRLQQRLAAILQRGEVSVVRPDGEEILLDLAVRTVATCDPEADATVHAGLLSRVAQVRIAVPPLRQRREDIPGLVRLLLLGLCEAAHQPRVVISRQALALLVALPWRGNLRELHDLLRSVVRVAPGRQLRLADVLACVTLDGEASAPGYSGTLREAREAFERDYVAAVLTRHRGRMAEAAKALGLQRTNLYRKVRQLSLPRRIPGRLSPTRYTEIDAPARPHLSRADTPS
jgi:DNA-binding NtrC family response regulator